MPKGLGKGREGKGSHVLGLDGENGRHDVNDRHEGRPDDGPAVDPHARFPEVEGPWLEAAVGEFADDGDAVGPVEGDGREVEDGADGGVRAQSDEVDQDAADHEEPDGVEGGVGRRVDLVPDPAEGEHFVAGVGPDGAGAGLDGGHGGEVEDEEGGDGEEDAAVFADDLVEDLGDRLHDRGVELVEGVAHGVGEDDVVEPAAEVGEAQGEGDRPGGFDLGVLDLLGDVRGRVVIGHGPGGREEAKHPRPAVGRPAGVVFDVGPDVGGVVPIGTHDQEGDAAGDEHGEMEHHVCFGHLLEGGCAQAVQDSVEEGDGRHDADGLTIRRQVSIEIIRHRDCGQEQLGAAIFGGRSSSNLTDQVQPATDPAHFGDRRLRGEVLAGEVESARGRVCGDEFGDGEGDAVAAKAGDQPAPDRR